MPNYPHWKGTTYSVTSLLLDPQNPRLPEASPSLAQRDIIEELVHHEKVYELARDISNKGFYPIESILIFKEGSNKYVVEGNRRIAALKLLINPDVAPEKWVSKFKTLSSKVNPNDIKQVRVIIAPSREATYPIMMDKHTQMSIEGWDPLMQAKFYHNLVDKGYSVEDLSYQYSIPTNKINELLRRHILYYIACKLDLPEQIAPKVSNPRKFPITTLDRFFAYSETSKLLGIKFDNNTLIGSIDKEEFKKGYKKIITDIAKGGEEGVSSRTDIRNYLKNFPEEAKPNLKKRGIFSIDDFRQKDSFTKLPKKSGAIKKAVTGKRKSLALIPSAFKYESENMRINDIINELKKIHVANFPNAAVILLRSLLEMSLDYFLYKRGHIKSIIDIEKNRRLAKGGSIDRNWYPTLKNMVDFIVSKRPDIIDNRKIRSSLNKLVSESNSVFSIDTLNQYVHNQYISVTEERVRNYWSQLEEVFIVILKTS